MIESTGEISHPQLTHPKLLKEIALSLIQINDFVVETVLQNKNTGEYQQQAKLRIAAYLRPNS